MSKSVRLKDYLAAELEEIAERENRSLANLVEHLLVQALDMVKRQQRGNQASPVTATVTQADAQSRDVQARTVAAEPVADHFRPDPKPAGKKKGGTGD